VQLDDKHRKTADELAVDRLLFDRDYVKTMVQGSPGPRRSSSPDSTCSRSENGRAGRSDSKALPEPNIAMRDVQVHPVKATTRSR
jgi:hypothetical protein